MNPFYVQVVKSWSTVITEVTLKPKRLKPKNIAKGTLRTLVLIAFAKVRAQTGTTRLHQPLIKQFQFFSFSFIKLLPRCQLSLNFAQRFHQHQETASRTFEITFSSAPGTVSK